MNYTLRTVMLLIVGLLIGEAAYAQLTSENAVGGRFGSASGLTYRYSLSDQRAVEGILSVQSNSVSSRFRLIGLYEYHKVLGNNFSWYYGYGGSIGSYKAKAFTDGSGFHHESTSDLSLSIDGIIGVEYAFPSAPVSISIDAKPYFDFIQESSIRFVDPFGFSIRYKF